MTCIGGCAAKSKRLLVVEGEGKSATIYVRIRESWITYLETLGAMLAEQPRASLACSPELIEPVISHTARRLSIPNVSRSPEPWKPRLQRLYRSSVSYVLSALTYYGG